MSEEKRAERQERGFTCFTEKERAEVAELMREIEEHNGMRAPPDGKTDTRKE
jgi:hypothetical protein